MMASRSAQTDQMNSTVTVSVATRHHLHGNVTNNACFCKAFRVVSSSNHVIKITTDNTKVINTTHFSDTMCIKRQMCGKSKKSQNKWLVLCGYFRV